MAKTLGKEYTDPIKRKRYLEDNADGIEKKGYMKPYTPEELQGHKERLANLDIEIMMIEEEKKQVMERFKERLKPLKEQQQETATNIMRKSEHVTEECYKFVDEATRTTEYFNADGDLVESRPATADELQPNIYRLNRELKDGTNN